MGLVKGRVTTTSGSPVKGAVVNGLAEGLPRSEGSCKAIPDAKGYFSLEFPGSGKLTVVSVVGGGTEKGVPDGGYVHLYKAL